MSCLVRHFSQDRSNVEILGRVVYDFHRTIIYLNLFQLFLFSVKLEERNSMWFYSAFTASKRSFLCLTIWLSSDFVCTINDYECWIVARPVSLKITGLLIAYEQLLKKLVGDFQSSRLEIKNHKERWQPCEKVVLISEGLFNILTFL